MSILRIVPGGNDFGLVRIGGPGLANLLWLWAKMVIAHQITNIPMEWPLWRQFKPKAFCRREFSMAYYPSVFTRTNSYLSKRLFRSSKLRKINGDKVLQYGDWSFLDSCQCSCVVEFSQLDNPFESYFEYKNRVRERLDEILKPELVDRSMDNRNTVCVHIRRGDFNLLNFAVSLDDYTCAMQAMREQNNGDCQFKVFTDAGRDDGEFWQWLPADAEVVQRGSPIEDLIRLSRSSRFIGTARSSFSRIACYLGDMEVIWCGTADILGKVEKLSSQGRYIDSGKLCSF